VAGGAIGRKPEGNRRAARRGARHRDRGRRGTPHPCSPLRRHRAYRRIVTAQHLQRLERLRRLATLAASMIEMEAALTDAALVMVG
jgi:hypothetical protein